MYRLQRPSLWSGSRNALNIQKGPDEMNGEGAPPPPSNRLSRPPDSAGAGHAREMQAKACRSWKDQGRQEVAGRGQRIAKLTDSIRFEDALKQAQTGKTLQEMGAVGSPAAGDARPSRQPTGAAAGQHQQQIDAIAL